MADLAHHASGPASLEAAGIAPQQASRPASSDRGKLRVFISYSRDDLKFADQLDAALNACGFECLIDRHGISGGEDWKRRLGTLISEADTVVFVLSPHSARSEICAWEVEEAARLNKRILPVNCRPLEGVNPPPRLRELNYVFFYEEPKVSDSGFGTGLASLVAALNTDFDWLREHTRYLQRAIEWDAGGRPVNRLLSGNDILEAKAWAARQPKGAPKPTDLQLDFIRASEEEAEVRTSGQRKQLEAIAAAQAAREAALHEREQAFRQAAEAQRRRARIRNIAIAVSILAGCLAFGFVGVFTRMGSQVRKTMNVMEQTESAEALLFGKDLAAIVEAAETKRDGRPGEFTAKELEAVADYALVARKFSEALDAANRAHTFLPNSLSIETMRAHALMFLDRGDEANALYLAHKGEPISELNNKLWERTIADDFAAFRKAGLTHPMMADVEKELGISR
jgi:hypothetical protein